MNFSSLTIVVIIAIAAAAIAFLIFGGGFQVKEPVTPGPAEPILETELPELPPTTREIMTTLDRKNCGNAFNPIGLALANQ